MLDAGDGSLQGNIQGLKQGKNPSLQLVQFFEIKSQLTKLSGCLNSQPKIL